MRIVKGGTISTTNRSAAAQWPSFASPAWVDFGNPNDLWGETWTGADINASTFGAATAAEANNFSTAQVDAVETYVYYVEAAPAVPSAAITGTVGDGANESEIRSTGGTIIITLTDDTWVAAGATFDAQRQNIIDGLDSAQSEATGWNAKIRDVIGVGTVVRTNDTVCTITIPATPSYSITANETITVTVPASALVTSASPLTATPTILITDDAPAPASLLGQLGLLGVGQ